MGEIGDSTAVLHLRPLLWDHDKYVRRKAAIALGFIADSTAVPHLIHLLQDHDKFVRSRAAEALGKIGDSTAVPLLLPLLQDKDEKVRLAAAQILAKIDSKTIISGTVTSLNITDSSLQNAHELFSLLYRIPFYRKNEHWFAFVQGEHQEVQLNLHEE